MSVPRVLYNSRRPERGRGARSDLGQGGHLAQRALRTVVGVGTAAVRRHDCVLPPPPQQHNEELTMTTNTNERPRIVSRDEWLAARKERLAKEKEATRARDPLNAERRLPIVEIATDMATFISRRAVIRATTAAVIAVFPRCSGSVQTFVDLFPTAVDFTDHCNDRRNPPW